MKQKRLIKNIIIIILAAILGSLFSISISAYEIWSNGLKTIPSKICLASNTTTNQRNRIKDALKTWNDGCFGYECLSYDKIIAKEEYSVKDGINCITCLYDDDPNTNATTFAVETYLPSIFSKWYLVEFDINFNTNNHNWYAGTSTCPSNAYDFESIALHELGHVLGLDHYPDEYYDNIRAPMYAYTGLGEMHREITTDDYNGIRNIYFGE